MKLPVLPPLPYTLNELVKKVQDLITKTNQQVNDLSEGRITAKHNALSAMPTTGTYKTGDFIVNSAPARSGIAGSRYIVLGWIRLTDGASHVLHTDWDACRVLTGD